jgi:hypothetical protein
MTVNVYDQASRYGVQPDPPGFYRWLIAGLYPAVLFQGWLDTRTLPFPGLRDRTCDTVADLAAAADAVLRWALVTAFQTEPDPEILDRLFEYMARLRRELRCGPQRRDKYQVVAAVVNLTGAPQGDTLEMSLPGLASPVVRLQVVTRTMRDEDAAQTLDRIAAGEVLRCLLSCDLLELLGEKFGSPIAPDLVATIEAQADVDVLSRWFKAAIRAETLEAFSAGLVG